MQINSSTIATFGGGLAVGVVIGIFAEIAFEKWQDKKAAQDMAVNPIEEEASDIVEKDGDGDGEDGDETGRHADSLAPMPGIEPGEPNKYSKQYKVYKREESDIPVFDGDKAEKKDELDRSPQIIITAEEYMNGKGSYEKIECTYAEDDQGRWMLTNDDGNVEMDVRDTIGESALGYFKHEPEMDDNESVVYVRNDLLGADYCVMKYPYME